jgi:hypothetical protein
MPIQQPQSIALRVLNVSPTQKPLALVRSRDSRNKQTGAIDGEEVGHPMRYGDPPDDSTSCLSSPVHTMWLKTTFILFAPAMYPDCLSLRRNAVTYRQIWSRLLCRILDGFSIRPNYSCATLRLHLIDLLLFLVHSSLPLNRSCQSTCCCTHSRVSTLSPYTDCRNTIQSFSFSSKDSNWSRPISRRLL